MDSRVSHRIPIHYPIVFLGDNFTGEGTVVDISEDGCAVGSDATVGPGMRLTLDIFLPDVELPIAIEQAVVRCLAKGWANKEVASALQIALPTVKEHIRHIMVKTNTTTRTGILVRVSHM